MATILLVFICSVLCLLDSSASTRRSERRLTTVENRLDTVNSEISIFRGDIADLWDNLHKINKSCNCDNDISDNGVKDLADTNSKEQAEFLTMTDIKTRFGFAFLAEKQARITFQSRIRTENKDNELNTHNMIRETNKNLNRVQTKLNELINDTKRIQVEMADQKLMIQELNAKYEILVGRDQVLSDKLETITKCADGWHRYIYSCYYISSDLVSWFQAREYCRSSKSILVEYSSMGEVNFVLNMSKTFAMWRSGRWEGFWVGANQLEEDGAFIWQTSLGRITLNRSQVKSELQYWLPGQPDYHINHTEDCMMTLINEDGKWNNGHCSTTLKFVCQRQLLL